MSDIDTPILFCLIFLVVLVIAELIYIIYIRKSLSNPLFFHTKKAESEEEEDNEYEAGIKNMVLEGMEQGVIEEDERELINNVFEFGDKEADEVMRIRRKIVGIDNSMNVKDCLAFMLDQPYSRFPLYEGDIDNILGILHLKDVAASYLKKDGRTLDQIAREAYFIHETMDISDLFKEMQTQKIHMAIVVDEYGQTEGIVAMEDILEVLVGNIFDEYDVDEREIVELGQKNGYLIQGVTRLEEVEELLGIEFPEMDIETINGFLINQLGHLPEDEETVEIIYAGYSFKSVDIHDKMIRQVKVSRVEEDKGEN